MLKRVLTVIVLATVVAAANALASEQQQPRSKVNVQLGQSRQAQDNGWNVSVQGNQQARNQEQGVEPGMSELTMTVYGRGRRGKPFGPVYDRRGRAMELDVTSELETCPDGNTRVAALRIGTWRYKMEGGCEDFRRGGHIGVSLGGSNTVITTQANKKKGADDSAQLRCDASTWTCRTE